MSNTEEELLKKRLEYFNKIYVNLTIKLNSDKTFTIIKDVGQLKQKTILNNLSNIELAIQARDAYCLGYAHCLEAHNKDESKSKETLGKGVNPTKIFKPEFASDYWCIDINGDSVRDKWYNEFYDNQCFDIGNCFSTEEEAQAISTKLKIHRELELFAEKNNDKQIDWNNYDQIKYCLAYNSKTKKVTLGGGYEFMHPYNVYFSSDDIAYGAIKAIGEDRIKHDYFGIRE